MAAPIKGRARRAVKREQDRREPVAKASAFQEVGTTGLVRYGGVIDEEFLPALKGRQAIKVFREMRENDAMVGAVLFAIEMLIRNVDWRVEPYSTDEADVKAQVFLEEVLDDMEDTWENTLSSILSFLPFGFSVHELVYKMRDGNSADPSHRSRFTDRRIGWRKLPVRAQETIDRWMFDDVGEVTAVVQQDPTRYGNYITIPIEKVLLFRTSTQKGNPEGHSVLRQAYRSWFFKRRIEEMEGIGAERDLAGMPVMKVPPELLRPTATAAQRTELADIKKIVTNVKRDEREGLVMPWEIDAETGQPRYVFELLSAGGKRQFDTTGIINRYDSRIAMTMMADFVMLGHEKVGSYALSSSKTSMFALAIGAWLQSIAAVFNRHAIPRLFALNNLDTERLPALVPGDIETQDLQQLGEYVSKLSGAGMPMFPDHDLEQYLREQGGLPAPTEEEVHDEPAVPRRSKEPSFLPEDQDDPPAEGDE